MTRIAAPAAGLAILFTGFANAAIIVDYGVSGNIAANAPSPITVPIDIADDGTATLGAGYVSGANVAPVVGVSGSAPPPGPGNGFTIQVVATGSAGFRVAGIGGLGVGNNFVDDGDSIGIGFDLDAGPAGASVTVDSIRFDESQNAPFADVLDSTGAVALNDIDISGSPTVSLATVDTAVAAGGGLQASFTYVGVEFGTANDRSKLGAVSFSLVIPEPASMGLLTIAGVAGGLRRR